MIAIIRHMSEERSSTAQSIIGELCIYEHNYTSLYCYSSHYIKLQSFSFKRLLIPFSSQVLSTAPSCYVLLHSFFLYTQLPFLPFASLPWRLSFMLSLALLLCNSPTVPPKPDSRKVFLSQEKVLSCPSLCPICIRHDSLFTLTLSKRSISPSHKSFIWVLSSNLPA